MSFLKKLAQINTTLISFIILLSIVLTFLFKALFFKYSLLPAGMFYEMPPWNELLPASQYIRTNHLLFDNLFVFDTWHKYVSEIMETGSFPLWNPFILCGAPLIASSTKGFFDPLNLVFLLFPSSYAFNLHIFLKLILSGIFTYLYARKIDTGNFGALVSAISFMFCGYMVGWLGHPHTSVALWMPALLLIADEVVKNPGAKIFIILSLVTAIVSLGTHYETSVYVLLFASIYLCFRMANAKSLSGKRIFKISSIFAAAVITGLIIAAVQLIPSWEYIQLSSILEARTKSRVDIFSLDTMPDFLLSIKRTIVYLMPDFFGHPVDNNEWTYPLGLESYPVINGYIGVVPILLSLLALFFNLKNSTVRFFASAALLSLLILNRLPVLSGIMDSLPVLSKLQHNRFVLIYCFSMSVLAGKGATLLFSSPVGRERKRYYFLLVALLFSAGAISFFLKYSIDHGEFSRIVGTYGLNNYVSGKIFAFLILAAAGLAAIFAYIRGWLGKRVFQGILLVLVISDLSYFASRYWPASESRLLYPETGAIKFLKNDKDIFRIFGAGNIMFGNTSGAYGIEDARGHDPTILKRYEKLMTGKSGDRKFYYQGGLLPSLSGMLNIKYILVPKDFNMPPGKLKKVYSGEIDIYLDPAYFPRIFPVKRAIYAKSPDEALGIMQSPYFDPSQEVILEERLDEATLKKLATAGNHAKGEVKIIEYGANTISARVKMEAPGFIVHSDNFYPGWKAYVNGRESRIYRANYTFRALFLDKGEHEVTFSYSPGSFKTGLALSLSALAFLAAMTVYTLLKGRKRQEQE